LTKNATNEDTLTQTILQTIKDQKPETVEQLATLVTQKTALPEQQVINRILKLQNQGKIKLTQQPVSAPSDLATYITTGQALWYWASIIIALATAISAFTIPEDLFPLVYIRYALGTIFVLWLPGYTFIKALFPTHVPIKTSSEDLDIIERIALSIGMSLALVPIVGLLLNYTPWGIRLTPIVLSLLALTIVFATVALIREKQAKTTKA
jgi:hypothetical protein